MLGSLGVHVYEHISAVGLHNLSGIVAAFAARLLATASNPFGLTSAEMTVRLAHPDLLAMMNVLLLRPADSTDALSSDDLLSIVSAPAADEVRTEHPWLLASIRDEVAFIEDIVAFNDLHQCVRASLQTYVAGSPAVHICIVGAGDKFFACAWQLTIRHMHTLGSAAPHPQS
mmetsp:Transcript_65690/g.196322  ORF Transcript_65690/g.196322 Transcript_65690/m.196322 type:complete len:172 (-) Transcript_65690:864-1379(-)